MEKPQKKISRASAARMISASKGSGLGLSIVRSIAELHAGSCGAGSYPGKGSTFWIEIPFYDHSSPA